MLHKEPFYFLTGQSLSAHTWDRSREPNTRVQDTRELAVTSGWRSRSGATQAHMYKLRGTRGPAGRRRPGSGEKPQPRVCPRGWRRGPLGRADGDRRGSPRRAVTSAMFRYPPWLSCLIRPGALRGSRTDGRSPQSACCMCVHVRVRVSACAHCQRTKCWHFKNSHSEHRGLETDKSLNTRPWPPAQSPGPGLSRPGLCPGPPQKECPPARMGRGDAPKLTAAAAGAASSTETKPIREKWLPASFPPLRDAARPLTRPSRLRPPPGPPDQPPVSPAGRGPRPPVLAPMAPGPGQRLSRRADGALGPRPRRRRRWAGTPWVPCPRWDGKTQRPWGPRGHGGPGHGRVPQPAPCSRGSAGWLAPGTLPPDRASDPGEAAASGWLT